MTTIDFKDAIAELVRQFPTASEKDEELATQGFRTLTGDPDLKLLPQASELDEVEWFDNFPV